MLAITFIIMLSKPDIVPMCFLCFKWFCMFLFFICALCCLFVCVWYDVFMCSYVCVCFAHACLYDFSTKKYEFVGVGFVFRRNDDDDCDDDGNFHSDGDDDEDADDDNAYDVAYESVVFKIKSMITLCKT